MNKNLHRVIFNKARGIRMVVQETASSEGKAGNGSTQTGASDAGALSAGSLRTAKSFLSAFPFSAAAKTAGMLALALGAPAGFAQIIADPSAPIDSAHGSGISQRHPTVNIQTPSAGGVSRNTYQQFDIGQREPSSTTAAPMCKPRLVAGCKAIHGWPTAAPGLSSMKSIPPLSLA